MPLRNDEVIAIVTGASFAAGLNVYATVATLGLLGRAEVVSLPSGLHVLTDWTVIAAAAVMFVIEFFADKIPAFDLIWNALHTFVRVPIAALLAYRATAHLSPRVQLISTIVGAVIALAAHGGKTAVRAAVTPSPEPVSNIALSFAEDAGAISLTWFATQHPFAAAGLVIILVVAVVVIIRWVVRALRALFRGAERRLAGSA